MSYAQIAATEEDKDRSLVDLCEEQLNRCAKSPLMQTFAVQCHHSFLVKAAESVRKTKTGDTLRVPRSVMSGAVESGSGVLEDLDNSRWEKAKLDAFFELGQWFTTLQGYLMDHCANQGVFPEQTTASIDEFRSALQREETRLRRFLGIPFAKWTFTWEAEQEDYLSTNSMTPMHRYLASALHTLNITKQQYATLLMLKRFRNDLAHPAKSTVYLEAWLQDCRGNTSESDAVQALVNFAKSTKS